ncbi:MAG: DNA gyrase subunit A, partial [Pelagibacteraceae bacterium]
GDNAAAMRYTEAKLTLTSEYLLNDIEEETVNFKKTYDGELEEPEILPSQFPNILANGASGIAVGMATSIPPHNIQEVCEALIAVNNKPNLTLKEILNYIKGPDFPTGGILNEDKKEIFKAYNTGKGFFELKSKYKVEDLGRGSYQIAITEIPYLVNKSKLIEKIADIIINKKNKLLDHVSDESDQLIRIVLRPKNRNVDPIDLMNSLYEQTDLKIKVFLNMNVLNEKNQPKVMSLKEILSSLLKHRYVILNKKINFRLEKIKKRLEILKGFLIVYANLNKIIKIIRTAKDPKKELIKKYRFSILQVDAILEMRLRNLKKIEEIEIKNEFRDLEKEKKRLFKILKSKSLQRNEINNEYTEIIQKFGNNSDFGPRKSNFEKFLNISEDELEKKLEVIENINISLIGNSYLKAKKGSSKFEELNKDKNISLILNCKTSDNLCFLSDIGKSYILEASRLKFGSSKGALLSSYLKLKEKEKIVDAFVYNPDLKLLVFSKNGLGFLVKSIDLESLKKSGKKFFNVKKNDSFLGSTNVNDNKNCSIILTDGTKNKLLIFKLKEIPELQKGSGVQLFKSKGFLLKFAFATNDNYDLHYQSNHSKPLLIKKINSFIANRGKSGKILDDKLDINFSRGFENNFKKYD